METQKTIAQDALELLETVPEDQWIVNEYSDGVSKCCAIGHYMRLKGDSNDYSFRFCDNTQGGLLRDVSAVFLTKEHGLNLLSSIASVNNTTSINGYTDPVIKNRVIHLLKDMIEKGY